MQFFARFWRLAKNMRIFTAFVCLDGVFFGEKVEINKNNEKNVKTPLTRGGKGGKIVEPQNGREAEGTPEKKVKNF